LAAWGAKGSSGEDGAALCYAEWVAVQQRVALLRAHAQCAVALRHGELAASIVANAQQPYR
jgi:hypothetical protein